MPERAESSSTEKKGISDKTCCHNTNGTNLIVCIDGTSNQFGGMNTNVIELYNLILKESPDKQRTWYNSGIGTYARPSWKSLKYYKKFLYHNIDLAIAWGFERTVIGAYRWLSDNYKDGDCIFLFGFSRGAYQVRVLSAMIEKVGLIHKGNEMQIPFAFELYADPKTEIATGIGSQDGLTMADRFKKTFSHKNVKVHFVGAWDTVSSIGIARGTRLLPRTVDGMTHVCYFRHALALDERRVKFLPEYACGGKAVLDKGDIVGDSQRKSNTQRPQSLEVWFAGTHSDIGGGNVPNEELNRSRPPLRWMVFEAQAVGLCMEPFNRDLSREEQIDVQESLTWPWWSLEVLPIKRLSLTRRNEGKQFTYNPHRGSARKIHAGQKIHSSLLLSDKVYNPKARPPDDDTLFWKKLRNEEDFKCKWVEFDLYEHAANVMEHFIADPDAASHTLRSIATSGEGRHALYKKAIEVLKTNPTTVIKCRILRVLIDAVQDNFRSNSLFKPSPLCEIHPVLLDLLESEECHSTAKEFITRFTDRCVTTLTGHEARVNSVAVSPDGKLIASASDDCTVRIWSVETWGQKRKLPGHPFEVATVAFFPLNHDQLFVSGSWDNNLRIWDADTGEQKGESLTGHDDYITTVAISPNGKTIASGSRDMTIQLWDVETGNQLDGPFEGQTGTIHSLAFSPSGNDIASASNDHTIAIWDIQEKQIEKTLHAHKDLVLSVSFSPDGLYLASGSADFTIRIFELKTGVSKTTLLGHKDVVRSVIFSPDGKRLASGSLDNTVRVWDVETGNQLGLPLQGHTDGVRSVAFSPDGQWIVSGSSDHTIRVWEAG